ncbi:hypothetical protein Nepgr_017226 [Nepenthes gracilis]|uniref:Uncharacterized protein n=1 Tax=Nepenthes gracilis TaxID=150966 RepID=A0AAD3SR35_NEPGR|nr:hypothetical protein Nepgr_017226 [Nepenthes gracilis]
MTETSSALHHQLDQLSGPLRELLSKSNYTPPESDNVSIKSLLESLLKRTVSDSNPEIAEHDDIRARIRDFSLCCALLSSSASSTSAHISWVPKKLSTAADLAFRGLSEAVYRSSEWEQSKKIGQFGIDLSSVVEEKRLVIELMPEVLPLIKDKIKESSIDVLDDTDEISAASARTPVAYAIVAAYQLRWFVTQVEYPHLGKLCASLIPCGLTALDHWSPEVKGQGMISFIHVSRNVNAAEIGGYVDVILDACCHNIVSSDEIWQLAVEMSVLLVTSFQRSNPRSPWFERMINEMLGHLERHPRDKERRIAWLNVIEPLFYSVGLVLLAHFRRLFPLFLLWVHADDDETVVLVLKRIHTVVQLTWIRNSPYVERLVDELAVTYKEAAVRTAREEIRMHIHQIMILLQQCKGLQFEAAWENYKDDPNLGALGQSTSKANDATVAQ